MKVLLHIVEEGVNCLLSEKTLHNAKKVKGISMYRLFILFWAIILSTISFAQADLRVKSMSLTTSHIPSADKRNDFNKKPCALVKIQVVDEVENIEGYSIGKPVKKSGVEHWAYMCDGSKFMKIHFKNHLPVEIRFRDYQIESLEGNKVYELVLQDSNGGGNPPQLQKLILNYSPANATVIIDNNPYHGRNGHIEIDLPVNATHNYLITSEGYYHVQNSVTLSPSAPRIITETLVSKRPVVDPPPTRGGNGQGREVSRFIENSGGSNYDGSRISPNGRKKEKPEKRTTRDVEIKPEKRTNREVEPALLTGNGGYSSSNQTGYPVSDYAPAQEIPDFSSTIAPATPLNKTFEAIFDGVTFKCKAKNGLVTIKEFNTRADNVTIPSVVEYQGKRYPVKSLDLYISGFNYTTKTIVIQKGIEEICNFCFREFRNLSEITIPNSIVKIERSAFRNPQAITFNAPSYIDVGILKSNGSFVYR